MTLDALLSQIEKGEAVSPADLLPYLCLERKEQRANVNALLAAAYARSARTVDLEQAKIFIQRAWFQWILATTVAALCSDLLGARRYPRYSRCIQTRGHDDGFRR